MASAKQQKPTNETCPQEQHKFWGGKVFGGQKQNNDHHQSAAAKEQSQMSNGWWFSSHKQAQHCSNCQCEGVNKKKHTIGVAIDGEHHNSTSTTSRLGKGTWKPSAEAEVKEQAHGGNFVHGVGKSNVIVSGGGGGVGKKKKEQHCFRSMADHVKQRIAMMKNNHEARSSDSSSNNSDSEDERAHNSKKKEKGQLLGTKIAAKNEKSK